MCTDSSQPCQLRLVHHDILLLLHLLFLFSDERQRPCSDRPDALDTEAGRVYSWESRMASLHLHGTPHD